MKRLSAEIVGGSTKKLPPFPWWPDELTLTSRVLWVFRLRRKTSEVPFVSPTTRFEAFETKPTIRPLGAIEASKLLEFPWTPAELTLTRLVLWVFRSRTKTS